MKEKLNVAKQLEKKYHKTEEVSNFKDMIYRSGDIYRNRTAFKIKDNNGEIKYDSVVGKGTKVMVKLPIEKGLN